MFVSRNRAEEIKARNLRSAWFVVLVNFASPPTRSGRITWRFRYNARLFRDCCYRKQPLLKHPVPVLKR
ncbi:MAG: hypothetical protein CMQ05_14750 [Gammaproteobacteria bacterium]|nr:hypothetical protein [Gammaproteobacteria bacterium]